MTSYGAHYRPDLYPKLKVSAEMKAAAKALWAKSTEGARKLANILNANPQLLQVIIEAQLGGEKVEESSSE